MQITREIPLLDRYDLVVCGGGPGGLGAAIAAARLGKSVALIEKNSYLGGMGAGGYVVPLSGFYHRGARVAGGIGWELVQRMLLDGAAQIELPKGHVSFHPEYLKLHAQRMAREAGVTLYMNAVLTGCRREGSRITQAFFARPEGEAAVAGDVFVDATGNANLCRFAGAALLPAPHSYQPMSLCFLLEGADTSTPLLKNCIHHDGKSGHSLNETIHDYVAGQPDAPQFGGPWFNSLVLGDLLAVNITRAAGDGAASADYDAAFARLREDAFRLVEILRRGFAEFKNAHIAVIAPDMGVRDARRMRGRYVLTGQELMAQARFDDTIAFCAHPVDIHLPDGNGQKLYDLPAPGAIPLRCLQSADIDNLLAAGRAISCDDESFASLRVMATAYALGEAAGTAACCGFDPAATRAQLQKQGAIV